MQNPTRDNTGWGKSTVAEKEYISKRTAESARLAKEGHFLASLEGDPPERSVLDMGCGIGMHLCGMSERGFNCTGIDISPEAIREAVNNALMRNTKVDFLTGDFTSSRPEGEFGMIIMMGGTFGLLEESENFSLLSSLKENLLPGGRIVLGSENREYVISETEFSGKGGQKWERKGGVLCRKEEFFDLYLGRLNTRNEYMDISTGEKTHSPWTSTRIYSLSEARQMAGAAGFTIERVYGSTLGHQYSASAKEMIIVAKKDNGEDR